MTDEDELPFDPPLRRPQETDDFVENRVAESLIGFFAKVYEPYIGKDYKPAIEKRLEPFLVLLDGAWGSGKTKVLDQLQDKSRWPSQTRPLVINFNAWLYQRNGPIWWALLDQMHRQIRQAPTLSIWEKATLTLVYARRFGGWFRPAIVVSVLLGTTLLIVSVGALVTQIQPEFNGETPKWLDWDAVWKILERFEIFLALLLGGGISAIFLKLKRWLDMPGVNRAEKFLRERLDPLEQIKDYFRDGLSRSVRRPLLVLVDDLDRCDPEVVVDCLNALQTLLRNPRIIYIVAAERRWLKECYESRLSHLAQIMATPGTSLGDYFLSKIFQLTVQVPRLAGTKPGLYALRRLHRVHADPHETGEPDPNLATRSSPLTGAEFESIVQDASALLAGNPRLINRLYYELVYKRKLYELLGDSPNDHRACFAGWTLLRLRWPLLAEFIEVNPDIAMYLPIVGRRVGPALGGGERPTPDGVALEHFPMPLREIFSGADWRAFACSQFLPSDARAFGHCGLLR